MSYNALDVPVKARELLEQIILEAADIQSSLAYELATSWCGDCPQRQHEPRSYSEQEFGVHYAQTCCKNDGQWEEEHLSDNQQLNRIATLQVALTDYLEAYDDQEIP